jgi:hypothetical protein
MIGFGQLTYVPDDNFEQALINLGLDIGLNNYVVTANIDTLTYLNVSNQGISDLTGIEDFLALTTLGCGANQLSSLDLSQNTALTHLSCGYNGISVLDLSQNTALTFLVCKDSYVQTLNVQNGNNINMTLIDYTDNNNLSCILVDDPLFSENNWPNAGAWVQISMFSSGTVSSNAFFSICCNGVYGCYGTTYVPDDNFEQALINLGYDNYLDNYVYTANIDTITTLDISAQSISYLTGIEDFTALTYLDCSDNGINGSPFGGGNPWITTNLPNLTYLDCSNNYFISMINTTALPSLTFLKCDWNQLTFLDLTSNDSLTYLNCSDNQLTTLDLTSNDSLTYLNCSDNQLTTLDVTNGNNINMSGFYTYNNSSLQCIDVDDPVWSNSTWTFSNGNIDSWTSFSGAIINDTTVCNSYIWPFNGQTYTTSGTYTDISTNAAGCTQTGTLNLTTNSTSNTTNDAACDTYTWLLNGQTYTTSGTYTDISTNPAGCDHTETLNLIINNATTSTSSASACDTYTWLLSGQTYTTSGTYTGISINAVGCDDTVTLNLTIEQNTSSYDTLSVTASIVWNGLPLSVSGDYSTTLINSVGCDSIVNLNLTVTTTGISDIANNRSNLVKITDMLGQETPYRRNTPLFYIYDDGTVEKRIVIE